MGLRDAPFEASLATGGGGRGGPSAHLSVLAAQVVCDLGAAPCAVVGAAHRRLGRWRWGWGAAGKLWSQSAAPAASLDTVFDLASLTKPIVALAIARCDRCGLLRRDEPLSALLPDLAGTPSGPVSLDLLSAHRAGLAPHREFFVSQPCAPQPAVGDVLRQAAWGRRGDCSGDAPRGGFAPVYSDLGYILLGAALATRCRLPIDELVGRQVAGPLGASLGSVRQWARRAGDPRTSWARVAPTEIVPWRGGLIRGLVHDENAWALDADGMAGHAGAFGDVRAVLRLGVGVLEARAGRFDQWLSAGQLEPLVRRRPGGALCAGFDSRSGSQPSSGCKFGPNTFGHLGFTGTSLWLDPDRELVGVLLSNRVHPERSSEAIRTARPVVYDGIFDWMGEGSC